MFTVLLPTYKVIEKKTVTKQLTDTVFYVSASMQIKLNRFFCGYSFSLIFIGGFFVLKFMHQCFSSLNSTRKVVEKGFRWILMWWYGREGHFNVREIIIEWNECGKLNKKLALWRRCLILSTDELPDVIGIQNFQSWIPKSLNNAFTKKGSHSRAQSVKKYFMKVTLQAPSPVFIHISL